MLLKIIPQITNITNPINTGNKTKFKFSLEIKPRRATAPAVGWIQRNNFPKAMAIATTSPQEKELFPKQWKEKTAESPPIKFPIIKLSGWAKALSSSTKRSTVEAPKGAINNDWLYKWIPLLKYLLL